MDLSFLMRVDRRGSPHLRRGAFFVFGLLGSINLLLIMRLYAPAYSSALVEEMALSIMRIPISDVQLWAVINGSILIAYLLICWRFWVTFMHIMRSVQEAAKQLDLPLARTPSRNMLREMNTLGRLVEEQARHRSELKRELEAARQILDQYRTHQELVLRSTGQESDLQYQSVLAYANYLDEHISRRQQDPQLRYDFDDVCESSFNLRLITGALALLRDERVQCEPVSLPTLMQNTMITLAPSLDRRAMKLTTAEVDMSVVAMSDAAVLSHVLWMMLLGVVRYAADESTLRMRCLYDSGRQRALLSIVVSALEPGTLTQQERYAHLLRQDTLDAHHMFADTLARHGNVQLAELLLKKLDADISVVPLSPYACELCLSLPAGPQK